MWILDSIASGMRPVPVITMSGFRVLVGLAAAWKILYEMRVGGLRYFDNDSFVRWRYLRRLPLPHLEVSSKGYRGFNLIATAACLALIAGIAAPYMAAILALWFFFERTFTRLYHPAFLALCCMIMALTPNIGQCLSVGALTNSEGSRLCVGRLDETLTSPLPQILGVLLTVQMYWSSAYIKARSPQYMSGDALAKLFEHMYQIKPQIRFNEITYPAWALRRMAGDDPSRAVKRWRWPSRLAVALEVLVPILLIVPGSWLAGVAVGILMHFAFTAIFAKRLVPFGLASVATYVLFVDPVTVVNYIGVLNAK